MWISSMNRDKTDCGGGKDKITWGAANKPPDISAEKWISRGRRFAEGMGTKSAWTDEEALDLLNTNAIMSPECEVWKDWCNLRVASDNRICPVLCVGGTLWEGSMQLKEGTQRAQLWISRNYIYGIFTRKIYKPFDCHFYSRYKMSSEKY